jgi:hypothetical protein
MNAYGVDPEIGNTGVAEWLPIGPVGEMLVAGGRGQENVPVTEFDQRSAHIDFYFPGKLAEELETALRKLNVLFGPVEPPPDLSVADIQALRDFLFGVEPEFLSTALCVAIRPVDSSITEESTEDNELCSPLALVLPKLPPNPPVPDPPPVPPLYSTPASPVFFDQLFQTNWGGRAFGFGVNFSASTSADDRGVIVNAQGALPVQAFGRNFDFFGVEGRAQVLPLSERDDPPAGQNPGFSLELSHLGVRFYYRSLASGSLGPLQIFVSKEIASVERTLVIGPVPVKLEAGVAGNIGAEYAIAFGAAAGNGLELTTAPYTNLEAEASASATAIIADVGVEGSLTLVEEKFEIVSSATVNVYDDRHSDGTSEIVIVPRLRAINEITGPNGAINAFVSVEVPTVRRCSWGFIRGVCPGLATVKYPYNLESWEGFIKRDTLLDEETLIDVITFPDGSTAYYK